jgi:hypothetical protein
VVDAETGEQLAVLSADDLERLGIEPPRADEPDGVGSPACQDGEG